jgi:hypothetical protein
LTITEVRLVRDEGSQKVGGRERQREYHLDFDGAFSADEADGLATFTVIGDETETNIAIGEPIESGSLLTVKQKHNEMIEFPYGGQNGMFRIIVDYGDGIAYPENPLHRADTLMIRRSTEAREITHDRNGLAIATYAKVGSEVHPIEIFANGPTVQAGVYEIVITGYREDFLLAVPDYGPASEELYDPLEPDAAECWIAVNDAPVTFGGIEFPPGTLGLVDAAAEVQIINGFTVKRHGWTFRVKPSWNVRIANRGVMKWNPDKSRAEPIPGPYGNPDTRPRYLSEAGDTLAATAGPDSYVYLNFNTTRPISFDIFRFDFVGSGTVV